MTIRQKNKNENPFSLREQWIYTFNVNDTLSNVEQQQQQMDKGKKKK